MFELRKIYARHRAVSSVPATCRLQSPNDSDHVERVNLPSQREHQREKILHDKLKASEIWEILCGENLPFQSKFGPDTGTYTSEFSSS
jgi:hypothetical protein